MITKNIEINTKALSDQIRISVTQAILQIVGNDSLIKITDGTFTVDRLEPVGKHLTLKLSIDVYPDQRKSSEPDPNS